MMIKKNKSYIDNRGSAIITALVISTILMVLCFSLLLVAYSLFISTSKTSYDLTQREMLYSAAEGLELELTDVSITGVKEEDGSYSISDDQQANRDFWMYIYTNIIASDDSWPYYDKTVSDSDTTNPHNKANSSKYFNMSTLSSNESEKLIVQLYWERSKNWVEGSNDKKGTVLNAEYRLYDSYSGEVLVKTDRKYILTCDNKTWQSSVEPTGDPTGDPTGEPTGNPDDSSGMLEDQTVDMYQSKPIYRLHDVEIYYQYPQNIIKIKNIGNNSITNWAYKFKFNSNVTVSTNNDYHFSCVLLGDGSYMLSPTNESYGKNISSQQTVDGIGLIINGNFDPYPIITEVLLEKESSTPNAAVPVAAPMQTLSAPAPTQNDVSMPYVYGVDYTVEYTYETWNSHNNFHNTFTITNISDRIIEDWKIIVDYDKAYTCSTTFSGDQGHSVIGTQSGNRVTVINGHGLEVINPGETFSFTIQGQCSVENYDTFKSPPTIFGLMPGDYNGNITPIITPDPNNIIETCTWKWNRIGEEYIHDLGVYEYTQGGD